jgi:hypothetical protein
LWASIGLFYIELSRCAPGLEALKNYRKEYDEKAKTFKNHPLHDWASHGADDFRCFAVGHKVKAEASGSGGPGCWMGSGID